MMIRRRTNLKKMRTATIKQKMMTRLQTKMWMKDKTRSVTHQKKSISKQKKSAKRVYRWRKKEPLHFILLLKGEKFSSPPPKAENITPIQYFQRFWDSEICKYLTEQTNLHWMQETGKSINVTEDKIEVFFFFGIQMTIAIVKMSQHEMY